MLVRYTPYRQHRAADTGGTGDFGKRRARGGAVNTCCPLVAAGVVAMVVVGAFVVPATTGYRSALQKIRNSVSPPPPPSLPPLPSPPPSPGDAALAATATVATAGSRRVHGRRQHLRRLVAAVCRG